MIAGSGAGNGGGISRFGARTGEVPPVQRGDLDAGDYVRTGSLPKVRLEDIDPNNTWYTHHNVPEAYRGLSVGEGEGAMSVADSSVERVLNALDPDESLRNAEDIKPELVAWLAVPVEYQETPLFRDERANVALVKLDELTELHGGLSTLLGRMQAEKNPPKTEIYLQSLQHVFQSNGNSSVDKDDPGKPSGKSGNGKPFRRGMTNLEFQIRFGGRRMYGAVNSLWKPGSEIESDDRSRLWTGICRFAAGGLAGLKTALLPSWEVSMAAYKPMAVNGVRAG